jgi:hypothetical protein
MVGCQTAIRLCRRGVEKNELRAFLPDGRTALSNEDEGETALIPRFDLAFHFTSGLSLADQVFILST